MKIAAVAFFCIILTGMAWPETVTVNAGLQVGPMALPILVATPSGTQ
jgi:hypothetical protein